MSVGELSEAMGMSYMGVKKHCIAMQKLGYLDTWRRPKDVGRPEKLYRITQKLDPLFPRIEDDVTLVFDDETIVGHGKRDAFGNDERI